MKLGEYIAVSRSVGFKPRMGLTLLAYNFAATIMEAAGVSIFLPIFQYIRTKGDLAALTADSDLWPYLVDAYALAGLPVNLPTLLFTAFGCFLARQILAYRRLVYAGNVMERLVRDLRNNAFRRYLSAECGYQESIPVGDLSNLLTNEVRSAIITILGPIEMANFALMTLTYLVVLMLLSPFMTLAAIVVLVASVFVLRGLMRRSLDTGREVFSANTSMSNFLVERLRSPRLVRLSGTETAERSEMKRLTERQRRNMVRIISLRARIEVAIEPLVIGASCVFLYFAANVLQLELERIGLYLVIALRLTPVIKSLVVQRQSLLSTRGSLEAVIKRLADMENAREVRGGDKTFAGLKDSIRFERVAFHYPGTDIPALEGVDLVVPAAKLTALVGPSGAGKSTLIDLLPRMRDPIDGRILFDGEPITRFSTKSLRAGISYAPQAPLVFSVSAAQHIRYGKPNATDAEVLEAAELAGAAEFIEALPDRYDTYLGEEGVRLSGGQRQRLDLARALVGKAPILILDEPTSNLDAEAEEKFRRALDRIRDRLDTTIIVVAHRLSTIEAADQIAIMQQGRVTEIGTHASLVRAGGWYARAYSGQSADAEFVGEPLIRESAALAE